MINNNMSGIGSNQDTNDDEDEAGSNQQVGVITTSNGSRTGNSTGSNSRLGATAFAISILSSLVGEASSSNSSSTTASTATSTNASTATPTNATTSTSIIATTQSPGQVIEDIFYLILGCMILATVASFLSSMLREAISSSRRGNNRNEEAIPMQDIEHHDHGHEHGGGGDGPRVANGYPGMVVERNEEVNGGNNNQHHNNEGAGE